MVELTKLMFSLPTFPRDRVNWGGVDRQEMGGGQFISLREAHIPNLSLLLCLKAVEKFPVVVVGWSRPVLGFSLSQAEQFF